MKLRSIAVLVLSLTTFALASSTSGAETPDSSGVVEQKVTTDPAQVESSWSRADFINAKPADWQPTPETSFEMPDFPDAAVSAKVGDYLVKNPTGLPKRLQGKVFFRVGEGIFSCSATLISSRYGNAVFTAGHCVFDIASKSFVRDFIFAPGYDNGGALGLYPATSLATTRKWKRKGSFSGDIGIATLAGTPVADMGGARPVAFNLNPKRRKFTIFGYPGDPAPIFDGERLFACNSRIAGRDKGRPKTLAAYPCHMGHGTSGGGWITRGYLNSVSSYFYCEKVPAACGFLFGPYFGKAARKLFTSKLVGGSITPTIAMIKHPPRKVSKRRVNFRFFGIASTPLRYRCKFDRRRYVGCRVRTSISRLSPGRHVLRVRAVDQTGRWAQNTLKRKFRVVRR